MSDGNEGPHGQSAYRQLLDEIREGRIEPGSRLREIELAERLGISRTPVREAIRQLEADGLVVHAPRQGATVRRLDHAEVIELYEVRAVFEGTAARLAARVASPVEMEELEAINGELALAAPGRAAQDLNRQFHRTLLEAARNRFLVKAVNALQKTMLILGETTLGERGRMDRAQAEHDEILAALMARDGDRAEAAMKVHIDASLRARIKSMRGREIPMEEEG